MPTISQDHANAYMHLGVAQETLTNLRSTFDHSQLFKDTYAITSRLKSIDRIISKVEDRRAKGDHSYDVERLTDIVGFRIITHYRDEIPEMVRRLFSLITSAVDTTPNYLALGTVREFLEYVPHLPAVNDPHTAELRAIYNAAFDGNPPHHFKPTPKGGYSSVHMVLEFPAKSPNSVKTGVEIQIRSIFEDAWGQIDHKLSYEQERRSLAGDSDQREALRKHLLILKKMLDSAADYADVIKSSFVSPPLQPMAVPRSLDDSDYLSALFADADISEVSAGRIRELMVLKRKLDSEIGEERNVERIADYVAIADEFDRSLSIDPNLHEESADPEVHRSRRSLRINVLLESALCRFLSEDRQQVRLAVSQYKAIAVEQPDNPTCWFRLGQALTFLATDAVPGSREAESLIRELDHAFSRAKYSLDRHEAGKVPAEVHFSDEEKRFIKNNLVKLHGFALWRVTDLKARLDRLSRSDILHIVKAYKITVGEIGKTDDLRVRASLSNNALYFGCYAYEEGKDLNVDLEAEVNKEDLRPLLDFLYERCTSTESGISYWDTVVHAAELLGDHPRGRTAAARVMDVNTQILTPRSEFGSAYATEMRNRAVQYAWRVFRE